MRFWYLLHMHKIGARGLIFSLNFPLLPYLMCILEVKVLASLNKCICTGLSEPSLQDNVISAKAHLFLLSNEKNRNMSIPIILSILFL